MYRLSPRYNGPARATHICNRGAQQSSSRGADADEFARRASFPACFIQPVPHQLLLAPSCRGVDKFGLRLFFGLLSLHLSPLSLSRSRTRTPSSPVRDSFVRFRGLHERSDSFVYRDAKSGGKVCIFYYVNGNSILDPGYLRDRNYGDVTWNDGLSYFGCGRQARGFDRFLSGSRAEPRKMFLERRSFGRSKLVFAPGVSALAESLRKFDEAFILVGICRKLRRRR